MSEQMSAARAAERAQRAIEHQLRPLGIRHHTRQSSSGREAVPPPRDQFDPLVARFNDTLRSIPRSFEGLALLKQLNLASMSHRTMPSPTSPQNTNYSAEFHRQLGRLEEHGISRSHAGAALQLWHRICGVTFPPEPLVERTDDDGLRFAWSTQRFYLDIQIYPDATMEWFFTDRKSGEVDGTEDGRESTMPASFVERLRHIGET